MPVGALGAVLKGVVLEFAEEADPVLPVLMREESGGTISEWPGKELGSRPVDCRRQWQGYRERRT